MIAGVINLAFSKLRTVAAVSVIFAALLFPIVVLNSSLVNLTTSESVRELVERADARGYGAAPVYGLGQIDRSAEFYAAGRVSYGPDGSPLYLRMLPR